MVSTYHHPWTSATATKVAALQVKAYSFIKIVQWNRLKFLEYSIWFTEPDEADKERHLV